MPPSGRQALRGLQLGGGNIAHLGTGVWAGNFGEANGIAITGIRQVDGAKFELVAELVDL